MIYFSQMVGLPVLDAAGESIGSVHDLGLATGEVFPHVTSLAFVGPGKTPFMISWRKYVESFDGEAVRLKVPATDIRFSYLQPDELLVARDLLDKQIVDTKGMRVVRVNDLKFSDSGTSQLRLLGAEVGLRGLLRGLHPVIERGVCAVARLLGHPIPEKTIAWSYMDLLDRDLKDVKLSVTHKTLDELHPADIADILEQLDPRLRGEVFAQLDAERAADAMAELSDDQAAEIIDDLDAHRASAMLREMDPDDAAELVSELDYEKAEALLHLMGVKEERAVRQLLGYREDTAGRIMTSAFVALPKDATVADAIDTVRAAAEESETVNYLYVVDDETHLLGVLPLSSLVISDSHTHLSQLMQTELICANPDDDQEDVAEAISKYNLLALPVVDEERTLLGIVTVDDALEVMEEEHEEDLLLAGGREAGADESSHTLGWLIESQLWFFFWVAGVALIAALSLAQGAFLLLVISAAFLPIALLAQESACDYAVGYCIEFDAEDKNAPSLPSFLARGLAMAIVYLILVVLVASAVGAVFLGNWLASLEVMASFGLVSCAVSVLVGFATVPLYVRVLRHREETGKDTRRLVVRLVGLSVCVGVYVLVYATTFVPLVLG